MSKCDNIRGTSIIVSLKRNETAQISWLTGGENFITERDNRGWSVMKLKENLS